MELVDRWWLGGWSFTFNTVRRGLGGWHAQWLNLVLLCQVTQTSHLSTVWSFASGISAPEIIYFWQCLLVCRDRCPVVSNWWVWLCWISTAELTMFHCSYMTVKQSLRAVDVGFFLGKLCFVLTEGDDLLVFFFTRVSCWLHTACTDHCASWNLIPLTHGPETGASFWRQFLAPVSGACVISIRLAHVQVVLIMAALRSRCGHYIFALWFLSSIYLLFSSPNLSRHRLDISHTCTHGVALVRI